ncbi:MAG: rhodanese-like domain-containing protein [Gemmatimonadota bacterium]|nr:rhodanese-like domain-containing protein [Gemmatimonadota bacterium]
MASVVLAASIRGSRGSRNDFPVPRPLADGCPDLLVGSLHVRVTHRVPRPSEPVTLEELRRRLRDDDVTLIDVRSVEEYRAAHIPGALSIP